MSIDVVAVAPTGAQPSAVSWGAILAGAATAAATTLALIVLASALGLNLVSPWASQNASATTFAISGALALIVIQWISSGLGGYMAGRLRTSWTDVEADEVFFRDTAHGLLTWCVATLIVAVCAAMTIGSAGRAGLQATATVAQGAATAGASALRSDQAPDLTGYFSDTLFRGAPDGASSDYRGEAVRILSAGAVAGDIPDADRTYLAQLVAQRAGVSQEEAQKRVDAVIANIKSAKQKAQETAEQVRKVAARTALFTFLSLLVGAFIASAAAAYGGMLREE